jgi:mRNA-degrading endonuclease RelE of RelBE toxin-antitoxin system
VPIDNESLSREEASDVEASQKELAEGLIQLLRGSLVFSSLARIWNLPASQLLRSPTVSPPAKAAPKKAAAKPSKPERGAQRARSWFVGMSDPFIKGMMDMDKKLQGRVLEAITHIITDPVTPKGDTVKPLVAELKGLWRYRIGDFRIVYEPDAENKRIVLMAFAGRGSVYD